MRPTSLREVVDRAVAGAPWRSVLDEFLDEFYLNAGDRQKMIADEPAVLGDPRSDAYIGAVGEHLARRWGLTVPAWTDDPRRILSEPYFDGDVELLKPYLLIESPLAFRRRMIFTELEPLRRARFPREEMIKSPYDGDPG